jgi:hypothetical protein
MGELRQRDPRQVDKDYKGWIAQLPCVACMVMGNQRYGVHVAHLRFTCAEIGLDGTGGGTKPHDWRVTPLCPGHHMTFPQAQHRVGEERFWGELVGINPADLCRALYEAYLAGQSGLAVIARFTGEAVKKRIRT